MKDNVVYNIIFCHVSIRHVHLFMHTVMSVKQR